MSNVGPPPLRDPQRWRKRRILLIVAGIIAIQLLIFACWRVGIEWDIHNLEQRARAASEPITLAELAASIEPVPDDENAAIALMDIWEEEDPEYWQAFRTGASTLPERRKIEFDSNLPVLGQRMSKAIYSLPWSENQAAAARGFLEADNIRRERIRGALDRPKARLPINLHLGAVAPLPHLSTLQTEAKRCVLAALHAATEGSGDAAVEGVTDMLRLAGTLRDEPTLLSQLVRVALIDMALNTVELLLSHAKLTPAQLDHLTQIMRSVSMERVCHHVFLGERASVLATFEVPIKDMVVLGDGENSVPPPAWFYKGASLNGQPVNVLGLISLDRRFLLATYDQLMPLVRAGDWGGIRRTEGLIAAASAATKDFPPKLFSGLHLRDLNRVPPRILRVEANRRCTVMALQVELYRLNNAGVLPKSLAEIKGAADDVGMFDPFAGRPMRLAETNSGYTIYSVGPDETDDGGNLERESGKRSGYDVGLRVGQAPTLED